MNVIVKLLGIGGAEIVFPGFRVFIDAFNDYIMPPDLKVNDIILFTHGDGDHFNASKTIDASAGNLIIGPPGTAYPLLAKTGLNPDLLKIVYPSHLNKPVELDCGELKIKVYQTKHFIDWEPDHVSYLLKYKDTKIYFTGDSHLFHFEDSEIYDLDALIYSLVVKEVVIGEMSSIDGAMLHIKELKDIQDRLKPKRIVGNHLIDCDWTVKTADIRNEIEKNGLKDIIIPENSKEEIIIKCQADFGGKENEKDTTDFSRI